MAAVIGDTIKNLCKGVTDAISGFQIGRRIQETVCSPYFIPIALVLIINGFPMTSGVLARSDCLEVTNWLHVNAMLSLINTAAVVYIS